MRREFGLRAAVLALGVSLIVPTSASFAAERQVRVTLPDFAVRLNGNHIENEYREYPLLVYKDITYFPMTWYDTRLLGLESSWTAEDGLAIAKGSVASSYEPYSKAGKNAKSYSAGIPEFAITMNGEAVDNSQEQYPLLSFNDVTYFPLTWKFAHDEFGWDYEWNDADGLTIRSDNPQVRTVKLPKEAGDNDVAVFKGYYYYAETEGLTNRVYRSPMDDTTSKELVYAYELDTEKGPMKRLNFQIRDDELWFMYHVGGALMGSDVYCKVDDTGKAAIQHRGYLDFRNTARGTLIISQAVPPSGNNLSLVQPGQADRERTPVGDPKLMYGWHLTVNESSRGFGADKSTTVVGDEVYVLGSSNPDERSDFNKIYKVNLTTNETVKIVDAEVSRFKIINNKLYYVKEADGALYVSDLNGANEQKVSEHPAFDWFEAGDQVYYTVADKNNYGQYDLYQVKPSGEDVLVLKEPLESMQFVNGRILCNLAEGEDYGLKIVDPSGRLELAVADPVKTVSAYDDAIVIVSAKDQSIKLLK
ncbi:DUF5050 domain-containing protein [Paenibacillus allorhizosphaerae]|uniref:Prolow-density lipoprotein receptor-related protein 1-like beta-propeller domain-containing protein n=1 Tax=Paenibacillus allorhizosphaerae TaxID=2849866 RepID=A0ABM8VKP1_9BACL|nr:DUF5050 domain-containing protein [Paenibacillus allorhizosphaerae]CAG7646698.1 hypothetical protein PAECIP111802_03809 [Paenibacillus allorhizosphaerae]